MRSHLNTSHKQESILRLQRANDILAALISNPALCSQLETNEHGALDIPETFYEAALTFALQLECEYHKAEQSIYNEKIDNDGKQINN